MKSKILFVIDHELTARIIGIFCRNFNYQLERADCEEMAIDMARMNRYELIMVDMYSRDNQRIETALKIRELHNDNIKAPIIGLFDDVLSVDELKEAQILGMNACVVKPILVKALEIILSEFITNKKFLDKKIYYFTKDGKIVGFRQ